MAIEAHLVWQVETDLGEGPMWSATEGALRFVDITGRRLHRFDPASGLRETVAIDRRPSFIVPA
jgi:xylono-1,5-lactonase